MTPKEAISILENLRSQVQATGEAHDKIKQAIDIFKSLVDGRQQNKVDK